MIACQKSWCSEDVALDTRLIEPIVHLCNLAQELHGYGGELESLNVTIDETEQHFVVSWLDEYKRKTVEHGSPNMTGEL
jgi:hypothetical protein